MGSRETGKGWKGRFAGGPFRRHYRRGMDGQGDPRRTGGWQPDAKLLHSRLWVKNTRNRCPPMQRDGRWPSRQAASGEGWPFSPPRLERCCRCLAGVPRSIRPGIGPHRIRRGICVCADAATRCRWTAMGRSTPPTDGGAWTGNEIRVKLPWERVPPGAAWQLFDDQRGRVRPDRPGERRSRPRRTGRRSGRGQLLAPGICARAPRMPAGRVEFRKVESFLVVLGAFQLGPRYVARGRMRRPREGVLLLHA